MNNQSKYSISSRILFRGKLLLDRLSATSSEYLRYKMSRDEANRIRQYVIEENGTSVVDKSLMRVIKTYCKQSFGSIAYWPWIALYTELRGEFKEGWIPDDYYRFDLLPKMNPERYMRFSEAKTIDHKLFDGLIVEPLLFRTNGYYYDRDHTFKTKHEVREMLSGLSEEIIIKPAAGRSGNRIVFEFPNDLELDSLPLDTDLVFQKVVKQHPQLNKLYPHSVNTFRVQTFIDNSGTIQVKFINLKFGVGKARIDNIGAGGGWVCVRRNGKVEPNAFDKFGLPIGDKHPDTGIKFSGINIPNIQKIVSHCKNAHREFPFSRIIGWDVFIDENEEPKLIEWNANNPGFWNAEALFGPFFSELIEG